MNERRSSYGEIKEALYTANRLLESYYDIVNAKEATAEEKETAIDLAADIKVAIQKLQKLLENSAKRKKPAKDEDDADEDEDLFAAALLDEDGSTKAKLKVVKE